MTTTRLNLLEAPTPGVQKSTDTFTYVLRGNITSDRRGMRYSTRECGSSILNLPMHGGVNYTLTVGVEYVLPAHTLCLGIMSQGFLASEMMGL